MSAAEIIEQIKALPPEEFAEVVKFFEKPPMKEEAGTVGVRTISTDAFARAKVAVFQKHDEVLRRLAQ